MKSKTLILMTVAIICGLAASYMTSRLLADRNEKVNVLVARERMAAYSPIKNPEEQFMLQEFMKNDVPRNAVTRFDALKDHLLNRALDKGEPVLADNLVDKKQLGLEVMLPQGKRAVAIRTTAEKVAGGFVMPGSRVDVIHTPRTGQTAQEAHVILQNILVRAVDQQPVKPEDRPGLVPATVTLEMTLAEAARLSAVQDTGFITLALRPFGDNKVEEVEAKPAPPPPPPPPPVEKVAEKTEPEKPPEDPVEKKVMFIQNGNQWIRATYLTQNGETRTTIERSQPDANPAPAPTLPSLPAAPGHKEPVLGGLGR
jgi:pilus assembly protein CpaB